MSQSSPPGSLLRLREADIVRVCGLAAAAAGLEIVSRKAVRSCKRSEGRLEGSIIGDGSEVLTWADVTGQDSSTIRWNCTCRERIQREPSPAAPTLACLHVAALLTSWIRHPASFDTGSSTSGEVPPASRMPVDETFSVHTLPPSLEQRGTFRREPTLADELARFSAADLLSVTRRVLGSEEAIATAKADIRRQLEAALSHPDSLAALIGRLEHEAQTLLAELLLVGGSSTARDFQAMIERGNKTPGALWAALGVLERHALVFPASDLASGNMPTPESSPPARQVAGWRVPAEICANWSPPLPIAATTILAPQGPPTLDDGDNPDHRETSKANAAHVVPASLRQLYLALALLAHAPYRFHPLPREALSLTSPASIAKPPHDSRKRHAGRFPFPLVPGDFSIEAAVEFARGAGIPVGLAQMARRLIALGLERGTARMLLDLPLLPAEDQRHLLKNAWKTWCDAELPLELADLALPGSRIRCSFDWRHEAFRPEAVATEITSARKYLLYLVRRMERGVWYSVSDFLELIWRINPFFLRGRQNAFGAPAWWLETTARQRPLSAGSRGDWMQAEAEYIEAWLTGPLHWWGILDLATTSAGRAVAIRLTRTGEHLLDRNQENGELLGLSVTAEEWGPALVVTHQGRLAVAPLAAGAPVLDALATWARPVGIAGGRIIYAFDAGSAAEAFDAGVSPEHLLSLLRQDATAAGQRALAAAEAQLGAWKAAYGASTISTGWTLLEARDEATLDEALLHVLQLQVDDAGIRRISPTTALVTARLRSCLEADLRKRGFEATAVTTSISWRPVPS